MADWFHVEAGRAVGPLSRIELEAALRSGRITPDTLVCEDGHPEWRLARKVPGLVPPKVLKAWQASVAAAQVEAPAPPLPAPRKVALAATPAAEVVAASADSPPAWRRQLPLIAAIGAAALIGGSLGAVLVLKLVARSAPADALPATSSAIASAAATVPAAAPAPPAGRGDHEPAPRGLRPVLPPAPAALPPEAAALVAARMQALEGTRASHRAEAEAFLSLGGLDASTLPSREALTARLHALDALRERNEELRRAISSAPDLVRAAAVAAGLPPEVADAAARRAAADLAAEARAREADAEMHDVAGEVLGLLESTFGGWRVADREHRLEFLAEAGPDASERYSRLLEDAQAIAAR